ncbi:MAG: hypothetical protein PVG14_14755 [Anaerolineales bacterium]
MGSCTRTPLWVVRIDPHPTLVRRASCGPKRERRSRKRARKSGWLRCAGGIFTRWACRCQGLGSEGSSGGSLGGGEGGGGGGWEGGAAPPLSGEGGGELLSWGAWLSKTRCLSAIRCLAASL